MSFQVEKKGEMSFISFENIINPWNILKEIDHTPYLKTYIIKNYRGGNTLVPREAWKEEGILYREIDKNTFLFPYESIGFILDDTISNVDIIVIEDYSENKNLESDFIFRYRIKDVEQAHLILNEKKEKISRLSAIYLFSKMKINVDNDILKALDRCISPLLNSKMKAIDYVESTLSFGLKGMNFVIKVQESEQELFYRIECKKRCKKIALKEDQIRNLAYLKKKLIRKHPLFPVLYSLTLFAVLILAYKIIGKFFLLLLLLSLVALFISKTIRKNLPLILKKFGFFEMNGEPLHKKSL